MNQDHIKKIIERLDQNRAPEIAFIKRASMTGLRLGVFSSSFNPPTTAHVELVQRAAEAFSLDEVLAIAGKANADKIAYECKLEDRLAMLELAFAQNPRVSIGLCSHAFFVDILEALEREYPAGTDLHFIVGFDTFERVLDFGDQYTKRYHRVFEGRAAALSYLFSKSGFIVASRGGSGSDQVNLLLSQWPDALLYRVEYLDFPAELGELSATEVRRRRREGISIHGLVPSDVEDYLFRKRIYVD